MDGNYQHCAALVRQADRGRYLAALFAPAERRDALLALYAFDIEVARVRDLAREPIPGEIRLQWWREVLQGERDGEAAAHPVAGALRETLARYGFTAAPLLELIDAHTFDLYDDLFADVDALELYAIRTRSPIFAMACGILSGGAPPPEMATLDASVAAAIGAVLANFPRHAARRQIYVPLDVIDRHGVNIDDIFAAQSSPALLAALAELRGLARHHLSLAREKLQSAHPAIMPAFLPMALIGPMLNRMEHKRYDPYRWRPDAAWRRQWQLWRAARNPQRIFL